MPEGAVALVEKKYGSFNSFNRPCIGQAPGYARAAANERYESSTFNKEALIAMTLKPPSTPPLRRAAANLLKRLNLSASRG